MKKLFLMMLVVASSHSLALNLQAWNFSNNPVYAIQDDALLDNGYVRNDYPWILTASYSYVSKPLTVVQNSTGSREAVLIDNQSDLTLGFGYRIMRELQIAIALKGSSVNFNEGEISNPLYDLQSSEDGFALGDIALEAKWRFYQGDKWAIALIPRILLGNGEASKFLSNEDPSYYLGLSAERKFRLFQMVLNLGYMAADGALYKEVDHRSQVRSSLGLLFPILDKLDINFEIYKYFSFPIDNEQNPSEGYLGARYEFNNKLIGFGGISLGQLFEKTASDYRVSVGLKYIPGEDTKPVVVPPPMVQKKEVIRQKLYKRLNLYSEVNFETARAVIKPNSYDRLNKVADIILEHIEQISTIDIEGHTDSRGKASYNKRLSQQRADSVKAYLLRKGVPAGKLNAVGYGEERPKVKEVDKKTLLMNRRVEFQVNDIIVPVQN